MIAEAEGHGAKLRAENGELLVQNFERLPRDLARKLKRRQREV